MRIPHEVMLELDRAEISQKEVKLANAMPRPIYVKVDKVLKAAGGKWNRSRGVHIFQENATDVLEQAMLVGEIRLVKQELGQFYTPRALADKAAALLEIHEGMTILEPSAGRGALADAAKRAGAERVVCVEVDPRNMPFLKDHTAYNADFLYWGDSPQRSYFRILMNPPFARQDDARHFLRAMSFLNDGGRIVAIMSSAVKWRETPLYEAARQAIYRSGGTIDDLPPGSFKESGTGVNAVLVTYNG